MNPYTYIFNNPLSGVDPTGYLAEDGQCEAMALGCQWDQSMAGVLGVSRDTITDMYNGIRAQQEQQNSNSDSKDTSETMAPATVYLGVNENEASFNHSPSMKNELFRQHGSYGALAILSGHFYSEDLKDAANIDELQEAYFNDLYGENGDYWRFKSVEYSGYASYSAKGQQIGKAALNGVKSSRLPVVNISPDKIRFSQNSVNDSAELVESMKLNGWNGAPVDVVRLGDGGLTSLDNTRIFAASQAGIDVKAVIHHSSDLLTKGQIKRFTVGKGSKKKVPYTWGEAARYRIGKQSAGYRKSNPNGSQVTGIK